MYRLQLILFCAFFLGYVSGNSQVPVHGFGNPSKEEIDLSTYRLDPEANAVNLYHRGHYKVELRENQVLMVYQVHKKIKVLDASKFEEADITIPYHEDKHEGERMVDLRAMTHNGIKKISVAKENMYKSKDAFGRTTLSFAFPDVQDGSILEYYYELVSPYFSNINPWHFSDKYPTRYSELKVEVPGNFQYRKVLYGNISPDVRETTTQKTCLHLPRIKNPADCEVNLYVMTNVPAIKEEPYMLSLNNYAPGVFFDLVSTISLDRDKKHYASSWKNLDNFFDKHNRLGRHWRHASYFKKALPNSILSIPDKTERAKAIFYFVQEQLTWNKFIQLYSKSNPKEVFEKRIGSSADLNNVLINALVAGGLNVKPLLLSTRHYPMLSQEIPVLRGFNNVITFLEIDGKDYFLDVTDKNNEFGFLPFYNLNAYGRVLDSKKGSYWKIIEPEKRNLHYATLRLQVDAEGKISGNIEEQFYGYLAVEERDQRKDLTESELFRVKSTRQPHLTLSNYRLENLAPSEGFLKESYDFEIPSSEKSLLYISTLPIPSVFKTSPFNTGQAREYPINLGYPIMANYLISMDLDETYDFASLPENKRIQLVNNDGEVSVVYARSGNSLNVRLSFRLDAYHYPAEAYNVLNTFIEDFVTIQKQIIEIKKV